MRAPRCPYTAAEERQRLSQLQFSLTCAPSWKTANFVATNCLRASSSFFSRHCCKKIVFLDRVKMFSDVLTYAAVFVSAVKLIPWGLLSHPQNTFGGARMSCRSPQVAVHSAPRTQLMSVVSCATRRRSSIHSVYFFSNRKLETPWSSTLYMSTE